MVNGVQGVRDACDKKRGKDIARRMLGEEGFPCPHACRVWGRDDGL
jgi:hypothetical protein